MSNNYFCTMPFKSLELSPDGSCQVCCKITEVIKTDEGIPYSIAKHTLNEIWNSNNLKVIRDKFNRGEKPSECIRCWTEEEAGVLSLRLQNKHTTNINYIDPNVRYISLKLSNKCNLACRICSPQLSSLWQNQYKKLGIPLEPKEYYEILNIDKLEGERLTALHELSYGLENIAVYGGEPLINDEALAYLKFLVTAGISKNVHLTMNTNGTVYTEELIEMLSHFNKVSLFLSIDDIGTRFEYQRWPAKWEKVNENILKYCSLGKPFYISIFPTLSVLNIFNLKEILDALGSYNVPITLFNIIHQPDILCLKNLPDELKQKAIDCVNEVDFSKFTLHNPKDGHTEFINSFIGLKPSDGFTYNSIAEYRDALNKYLDQHDEYRSTFMKDYLPELYERLK